MPLFCWLFTNFGREKATETTLTDLMACIVVFDSVESARLSCVFCSLASALFDVSGEGFAYASERQWHLGAIYPVKHTYMSLSVGTSCRYG